MKTTNKKEFSRFLNKFEKLLDYQVGVLGNGVNMDIFRDDTERFLKISHCRFILSTESGKINLKISFFDKNKNEVFSEKIGESKKFEILKSKDDNPDIATSSPIDLSNVGMRQYNFFGEKTDGKNNYNVYKKFTRVAITNFDFLYNNFASYSRLDMRYEECYLSALNELLNILLNGNRHYEYNKSYIHILEDLEGRRAIFGEQIFMFNYQSEKNATFEFIIRKIERSIRDSGKPNKDDIISLLNILNVYTVKHSYNDFSAKLNLAYLFIKDLKEKSKFKLEEAKHPNVYKFVRDITMNKSNDLVVYSLSNDKFVNNGAVYTSELKVSDLKSTFCLVAKK